ncbi:MAG: hypothetical protein J6U54_17455 [Clostridiales bacterium]|nr:hypothetical protein [Clostridiales bacterium]
MASELYERMGQTQSAPAQSQNPKDQALNMMRQYGFNVTGKENDPGSLIQMVMQSGMVPSNRLSLSQNVLARLMGRR